MNRQIGYARVSSKDQNEDRQMIAMQETGIALSRIYLDKQSGKDFERPEYKKMIKHLKQGDVVYVKSIDRLGRNYEDILTQWKLITKEIKADIVVLDMPILDTRHGKDLMGTLIADLVLALLSFFAENERENISRRQAEGIAAAKQRGVKFGAPELPLPDNFGDAIEKWKSHILTIRQAANMCGMAKSTFYDKATRSHVISK